MILSIIIRFQTLRFDTFKDWEVTKERKCKFCLVSSKILKIGVLFFLTWIDHMKYLNFQFTHLTFDVCVLFKNLKFISP